MRRDQRRAIADERRALEADIANARSARAAGEAALAQVRSSRPTLWEQVVAARASDSFGDELTVSFTLKRRRE